MPLEPIGYRDNLERLDREFPNQELLKKRDVTRFFNITYPTASKLYSFNECNMIAKALLAREMCRGKRV